MRFAFAPIRCAARELDNLMDIYQLELFLAVMDSPSMTRAAEKIHLSPGAVSLQLHNLADELRTELFVRRGKRLIPTPAALRLAELAKQVVTMMGHIQQAFENDVTKDIRPFHFATVSPPSSISWARRCASFANAFPTPKSVFTVGVTEEMVAGLLERRFDLALISLPVSEAKLKLIPLFDEELLIIRPTANKIGSGHIGSLRAAELAEVPFLLYPKRSNVRLVIDSFFEEIGVTPRVVMEADDTEAIKRLVESGFGIPFFPSMPCADALISFKNFASPAIASPELWPLPWPTPNVLANSPNPSRFSSRHAGRGRSPRNN